MYYTDAQTYLNEEFRKPIKHYLEGMPAGKQKKIMKVVDYLCDQYRELNGTVLFYENKLNENEEHNATKSLESFLEWKIFMEKMGYSTPIDYDSLKAIYSNKEVEDMLSEE